MGSRSGTTFLDIPLVQPCKLILAVLVPLTPAFQIILIVQPTTDGTTTRQVLADVLPLHTILTKLDDFAVFLGRPFGLLLGGRLEGMVLSGRQPFRRHRRARLRWQGRHAGGDARWR